MNAHNRGLEAQKWSPGGSIDQSSQIPITLKRSRIRIRIKVESWIRIKILIRIKRKSWIRIRICIKVMRIRNPAYKYWRLELTET
jgi:hypothetical protein